MNTTKLRKFDENNIDCYRCKHFLNIPQNLIEACEKISDYTEDYEADIAFIQAVVWLKSMTMSMKDISIEQFHLVFHKQWNSTGKDFECCNRGRISEVEERDRECLHSTNSHNVTPKRDILLGSYLEYANSINSVCNVKQNKKCSLSQHHQQSNAKQNDEDFIKSWSDLSIFDSRTRERYCKKSFTENSTTLNNFVISESDTEYSSCSDIFKDSFENEDINKVVRNINDKLLEGSDFDIKTSVEKFLLTSCDSNFSRKCYLKLKNDVAVSSGEDDSSDENCSNLALELITERTKVFNSHFSTKNLPFSVKQDDNVTCAQKDSAYDTYLLSGDCSILQNEDVILSGEKIDNIISYPRENNGTDVQDLEFCTAYMTEKDRMSDKSQQSCLSSLKLSFHQKDDEGADLISIKSCERDAKKHSEGCESSTENTGLTGSCAKKRKLDCANETDCTHKENIKVEKMVPSKWLKFTLDALSTDNVAFQSVKVILSILQDERISRQYMRKRCWNDTLEAEAVNTILNFRDVYEAEKKSNACTHEILQTVTNILEKGIGNPELNKITILTHEISIALELCNSTKVCIETINYLITKLKSQEGILVSLMNGKKADVYGIVNQLHIIFYALTLCFQKYRLFFSTKDGNKFEDETIPPVVDLWKKQLKSKDMIVEDSVYKRERRWLMILDDFTVVVADNFTQFAEKSRQLVNILTCK
ncbi:uncharacterized protein LOC122402172 [Colletes gigas]|uniref:uncharacterized protein LOC122402172 n=1 Tax=Colletes gigas TaxID=935657 RepID=UPI001C9B8F82|nr:uncharacterized protein LOC122402172 [Colletes gigas]